MDAKDLTSRLQAVSLDPAELEHVIRQFFGHGKYADVQEIHHARTHNGCALRVIYNDDGTLSKILAGPDLQQGEIEQLQKRIEAEMLTLGPVKVRRRILFSSVPTQGAFRYKDMFQIFPVPPEAPRPKFLLGEHPLFLEFAIQSSSNFLISNLRQERIGRQLELVLSSLLTFGIRTIGSNTKHHWTFVLSGDTVALPSQFLQEGYGWDGAVGELDNFSTCDEYPELARTDVSQYYSRHRILVGQALDIPSDIVDQLDTFFSLSASEREKFLRASYWFQQAHHAFTRSRSASFVALVSAIEALMPPPQQGKQCPECKQMLGTGPTKQFIDFVDMLAPGIPKKERKRFYHLRSAIAHGGKLLLDDQGDFWGFTPQKLDEGTDVRIMWKILQTVLHNWLREHSAQEKSLS